MEELSVQPREGGPAVRFVSCDGVSDPGKMYPDLMRSSGVEARLQEAEVRQVFEHAVAGLRRARRDAVGGHALSVARVTPDGRLDSGPGWSEVAAGQGEIAALGRPLRDLSLERLLSGRI
jgi:hypothetical protein